MICLPKYRLVLALLAGFGFVGVITLVLNLPFLPVSLVVSIFLLPGGLLGSVYSPSDGLGTPLIVMAANALVYSVIAYAAFAWWFRNTDVRTERSAALIVAGPALGLFCLACVPSLSPLWPQGMTRLAEEEQSLRDGLPVGSDLEYSRAFLQARGVRAYEEKLTVRQVVLERGNTKLVAQPGDQLVSARIATDAGQFPCGYAIEVLLIFDANQKL